MKFYDELEFLCSIPVKPEFIVQDFYLGMFDVYLQQPGSSVASAQPHAYLKCGHVHGLHMWNAHERNAGPDKRTCPVCLQVHIESYLHFREPESSKELFEVVLPHGLSAHCTPHQET